MSPKPRKLESVGYVEPMGAELNPKHQIVNEPLSIKS